MTENPISIENKLPGTTDWQLQNPATKREIEGYASSSSVSKNENIKFYVNTSSLKFSVNIYRMGWYNGKGARHIKTMDSIARIKQNIPIPDKETGKVECNWSSNTELTIPKDWTTGIYVAKLEENLHHKQSYIIFTVKEECKKSDILFQLPVTTYQAYNYWGGKSLYDWGSGFIKQWGTKSGKRASKVSFNRPYVCSNNPKAAHGVGAGEFFTNIQPVTTHFFPISSASWDYNMVRWLEKNSYNVSYCTNIDIHEYPEILKNTKTFMSHGHDEYWTAKMRENIENALLNNTNLTFFSSNTMFWQVRLENSTQTNEKNKTLVCYKETSLDPIKDNRTTINFRDSPVNNPESKLLGVEHFMDPVDGDIHVCNEEHWVFKGTNLKNGDKINGLLGYEIDGVTKHSPTQIEILTASSTKNLINNNYLYAIKTLFQKIENKFGFNNSIYTWFLPVILFSILGILSFTSFIIYYLLGTMANTLFNIALLIFVLFFLFYLKRSVKKRSQTLSIKGVSNAIIYTTKNNAKVFATGSMQWSWGLDDYNSPNLRTSRLNKNAEIITKNILDNFIS